jgi:hypothetical protein
MSADLSIKIQALVRDMDSSMRRHKSLKTTNPAEYRKKVEEDNQVLYHEYASIFEMHIQGRLDQTFFEMLKMRRKIEKGEITEDEASKQIGQKLFDRYVGPVINKTPPPEKPMSYSDYYKQYASTEDSSSL